MQTQFDSDRELIESFNSALEISKFSKWVDELEVVMDAFEKENGFRPYDKPLYQSTGLTAWYDSYAIDMSPQDALDSDIEHWDQN